MRDEFNKKYVDAFNEYLNKSNKGKSYTKRDTLKTIEQLLNPLGDNNSYAVNFLFENDADWGNFRGCKLKNSDLELKLGGTICLVHPKFLETVYVQKKPDLSFMRLKYKRLTPTGVYSKEEMGDYPLQEDVMEIGKKFYPIGCWENKSMGEDENGRQIPLPNGARPLVRILKGGYFLIVSAGSFFNEVPDKNGLKIIEDVNMYGKESKYFKKLTEDLS